MSYIVLSDRIKEISYSTGTTNLSLEGAARGFSSFGSAYSNNDTVFYAVTDGTDYEVGSGVYVTGVENQLVRFPLRSSNSNLIVDFSTGLKEVYVTYPATHSVYHGSGIKDLQPPEEGGVAFWISDNMVGYDDNFFWDSGVSRLGLRTSTPQYTIDIGGYGPDSNIQASGFLVGTSGVFFPEANNGDVSYPGGRQVVHFEPNDVLETDSALTLGFSGDVNQFAYLKDQAKGFVLAGPPSGCGEGCSPATPFFRPLTLEDIPNLDSLYATDGQLSDVSGVLENMIDEASGALNYKIVASGLNFLSTLSSASGAIDNKIDDVSGVLENQMITSGIQFLEDLSDVSGVLENMIIESGIQYLSILDTVSGIASSDAALSGILRNDLVFVSGLASSDLEVSGIFRNDIINLTSIVDQNSTDIDVVSGVLNSASGSLQNSIDTVSTDASGSIIDLNNNIIQIGSGNTEFNNLYVNLNNPDTSPPNSGIAVITRLREGNYVNDIRPTHFRIQNSGDGSRLLLDAFIDSGSLRGNTWGVVSLSDGAFRVYGYDIDIPATASGVIIGNDQVILDSGWAWENILPKSFIGVKVSGSFINGGSPDGFEVIDQFPISGHILTLDGTPSTASFPQEISFLDSQRNGISINASGDIGLDLDPQSITSKLDIRGDSIRIRNSGIVSSVNDPGYKGEIRWDDGFIYVCVANNTWKRASLSAW